MGDVVYYAGHRIEVPTQVADALEDALSKAVDTGALGVVRATNGVRNGDVNFPNRRWVFTVGPGIPVFIERTFGGVPDIVDR